MCNVYVWSRFISFCFINDVFIFKGRSLLTDKRALGKHLRWREFVTSRNCAELFRTRLRIFSATLRKATNRRRKTKTKWNNLVFSKMIFDHSRFLVRVSYLEIYNEEIRDLLGKDHLEKLEVSVIIKRKSYRKRIIESFTLRGSRKPLP
jgi:hypothetical protein